jgi:stage II sporulation protein E
MVSDGVMDCDTENQNTRDWISDYLQLASTTNPKEIVDDIMLKAKEMGKGKTKDDMTVIVSKIYTLF